MHDRLVKLPLVTAILSIVLSLINSMSIVWCVQELMAESRRPRGNQSGGNHDGLADAMREMAQAMQAQSAVMMEQMNQRADELIGTQGQGKFSLFKGAGPPEFKGTHNPEVADGWIQEMEKVFTVVACSEEQKVAYASYMLKGEAAAWWKGAKNLLESAGTQITWEVFCTTFYKKYFPNPVRKAKEVEFLLLTQGDRSVAEYTAKFEELIKHSTSYQRDPDEAWKCMKYESGLRPDILTSVATLEITEYAALVSKCQVAEDCNRKLTAQRAAESRKRFAPQNPQLFPPPHKKPYPGVGFKGKQPQRPAPNLQRSFPLAPMKAPKPHCSKCGKNHGGECRLGQNVCFKCGKPGHFAKHCPTLNRPAEHQPTEPKPKSQG